ncbi:Oidioi.mRNA.OKI2018_I69.chr1.g2843.t1.cds [Oikopleura dioica]|uniref:Oidioi.mRNA.OKI2018_I69.chr1.g2843.t1.cds n=1 Tax=Oikopleura dioica TaxID=34765 RepID=A0ABN7T1H2_OIKDI|nr:Oidioi.mRNA.OKI2018_I69.chr1.g2843.t1.cds [Oikopleura dioica]
MKLLKFFFAGLAAGMNIAQHYLADKFADDHNDKLMILMNPAFKDASFDQSEQMKMMLPLLLMDAKTNENSKLLMMLIMQDPQWLENNDNHMLFTYLMNAEDDTLDFKTMFLMTNMFRKDCNNMGAQRMNSMIPLLLGKAENGNSGNASDQHDMQSILTMMMFMSSGEAGLDTSAMLPLLMEEMVFEEGDFDHDKKLLFWVMMSMMSGGSHDQQGFNNNFNMMLPLIMRDCNDAACEKQKLDIMTVMIAMQSNAPNTAFGPDMMIPLMLMGNTDNNQELMFFMMTQLNNKACDAPVYYGVHH